MKFKLKVPTKLDRFAGKAIVVAKKHAPTAAVVSGTLLMGYAGWMAYKNSDKIEEGVSILERAKDGDETASRKEGYKKIVYAIAGPALTGLLGAGLILGGHKVVLKRNYQLATAYHVASSQLTKLRNYLGEKHPEVLSVVDGEVDEVPISKEEAKKKNPKTVEAVEETAHISQAGFFADLSPELRGICEEEDWGMLESMVRHIVNEQITPREMSRGYVTLANVWAAFGIPKEDVRSEKRVRADYRQARDYGWTDVQSFDYTIHNLNIWVEDEEQGTRYRKERPFISFIRPPKYMYSTVDEI